MQYVGQTKCKLIERFREHFNKKTKQIDTFLYKHFTRAGNSLSSDKNFVQPNEEMIFNSNSTERYKTFSDMKPNLNHFKHLFL